MVAAVQEKDRSVHEQKLFSLTPGVDFATPVLPFLHQKSTLLESSTSPILALEDAAYRAIINVLETSKIEGGTIYADEHGVILIVQSEFAQQHPSFVQDLLWARMQSRVGIYAWDVAINSQWYGQGMLDDYHSFYGEHLPVICVQVDDVEAAARFLGTTTEVVGDGLAATWYWKASEHLVLGCTTDPEHDYPSYIDCVKGEKSVADYLIAGTTHERLHVLVDRITLTLFGVWHTWLNEGFANHFRGHYAEAIVKLRELERWPTIEEVMTSNEQVYKYEGSELLLALIGALMAERVQDEELSPTSGIYVFLGEMARPLAVDESAGLSGLNARALSIIGADYAKLNSWWQSFAHTTIDTPLTIGPLNPWNPTSFIRETIPDDERVLR